MGQRVSCFWSFFLPAGAVLLLPLALPTAAGATCGSHVRVLRPELPEGVTPPSRDNQSKPETPCPPSQPDESGQPRPCPGPGCSNHPVPVSAPVTGVSVRLLQDQFAALLQSGAQAVPPVGWLVTDSQLPHGSEFPSDIFHPPRFG